MRLILPARAVSFFGDSLAFVVLSLQIANSDRPALMTLLFIAFSVPLFALSGVAGRIVDEHDSRHLLVGAGSLQVIASLGLVWGPNVWAILGFVLLLQTTNRLSPTPSGCSTARDGARTTPRSRHAHYLHALPAGHHYLRGGHEGV